jgi:hypothetical protein
LNPRCCDRIAPRTQRRRFATAFYLASVGGSAPVNLVSLSGTWRRLGHVAKFVLQSAEGNLLQPPSRLFFPCQKRTGSLPTARFAMLKLSLLMQNSLVPRSKKPAGASSRVERRRKFMRAASANARFLLSSTASHKRLPRTTVLRTRKHCTHWATPSIGTCELSKVSNEHRNAAIRTTCLTGPARTGLVSGERRWRRAGQLVLVRSQLHQSSPTEPTPP